MSAETQRYVGRIASVPGGDGIAFIGINSVACEDGSPHGLPTESDVFLHQDECSATLSVGATVSFEVIPDARRGEGTFRAQAAMEIVEPELLPEDEALIPGFDLMAPLPKAELVVRTTHPSAHLMKDVPEDTVRQVRENEPMPSVPREEPELGEGEQRILLQQLLHYLFPAMAQFGADFSVVEPDDEALDAQLEEAAADQEAMGMTDQVALMREQVQDFRSVREVLRMMFDEGLVVRQSIIPIENLPDLFMAVPVWYFWADENGQQQASEAWADDDPQPHEVVQYFCDLFPGNDRWAHTYQLFNRRLRTLRQYKGEVIPPHVARLMRAATELFDYVVIMTPYHDEAGKDWEDINWLRAIDPYVVGFKRGLPVFFVLARYSDAGTFPLYEELVADTIEFLRTNKERLEGFARYAADNPYWHRGNEDHRPAGYWCLKPASRLLMAHVDQMLAAFEKGNLFDWLRMIPEPAQPETDEQQDGGAPESDAQA